MFIGPDHERQALAHAATRVLNVEPYDFGLGFGQAFDDMRARLVSDAEPRLLRDAYEAEIDRIHQATGTRLANPISPFVARIDPVSQAARALGLGDADPNAERLADFTKSLADLKAKHPDLALASPDEILGRVAARTKEIKDAAEGGAKVGWGDLGRFAGGAVGAMTDPVNIASLVFGGAGMFEAAGATLVAKLAHIGRIAAQEGLINAGVEAANQPQIMRWNEKLGIEHGISDAALSVGMAGLGGAAFGGLLAGAAQGGRAVLGQWRKARGTAPAAPEVRAAESILEARIADEDASPFPRTVEGDVAHAKASAAATRQVLAGEPVDVRREVQALGRAYDQVLADPWGAADDPLVRITPKVIEETIVARGGWKGLGDAEVKGSAWGLVKFIWKHGEESGRAPHVTRQDVLAFPEIIRNWAARPEPIPNETGSRRVWAVDRSDGMRIVYVDRPFEDARRRVVTIYVDRKKRIPLSERLSGPFGSANEVHPFASDTAGDASTSRAPEPDGPAEESLAPNARKANPGPLPPELAPPKERPQTLAAWLKRRGGVNDDEGWLQHMGVTATARPGLINSKGLHIDDAARAAWEEGFFPEFTDRPSIDQLRDALAEEIAGRTARVRLDAGPLVDRWAEYRATMAEIDRLGVDPYGKSYEQVMAEMSRARQALDDIPFEDAVARFTVEKFDPEQEGLVARLDKLLDEHDILLSAPGLDDEGRVAFRSARAAMKEADDELAAWDAALFCTGRTP